MSSGSAGTAKREELDRAVSTVSTGLSGGNVLQFYCSQGVCRQGRLSMEILSRLEAEDPINPLMMFPLTVEKASEWLDEFQRAMFAANNTALLGQGGNGPSTVWVSAHGELVLEWSARGKRLSFFLHTQGASAVVVKCIDGAPVTAHFDSVPPELAVVLLLDYRDGA